MKIAGSALENLLTQATGLQNAAIKEVQRVSNERAAMSNAASPEQAAVSVHISAAGRAASAVSGTAGLAATARTQGTLQVMDAALRQNRNSATPRPQMETIRRIVEQATGKQIGAFNSADLGPLARLGVIAQQVVSATAAAASAAGVGAPAAGNTGFSPSELLRYSASGQVKAQDGAQIAFSILLELELERSRISRQSMDVIVNRIGMAAPLEAAYAGSASDLEGHAFSFDLGVDGGEGADRPVMIGAGVLAFEPRTLGTEASDPLAQPGAGAAM